MEPDEIYDVLMEQLLKAAHKYDPHYSDKMGRLIELLSKPKTLKTTFTLNDINHHLDFDCTRFVRVLCRHGFLESLPEDGDLRRYRRKAGAWPPSAEYLHAGPIGFTYYLQTWFRYYLQGHIEHARAELEAHEGVYSLDYTEDEGGSKDSGNTPVDRDGAWWKRRVGHEKSDLDLSNMDLDWVAHTEDPLFSGLSRTERLVLYLVFVREFSWEKLGDALQGISKRTRTGQFMPAARSQL